MGKYLKLFETHVDYAAYIGGSNKVLPNVSYCENENEVHYNPTPTIIPPVGKVQVFANPECTEYADGQSNEVWVRLNQAFGFNEYTSWGGNTSEQLDIITPTTEYPEDDYGVSLWVDWNSEYASSSAYTSGQIIKCINRFFSPIDNPKVIFE